MKSVNKIDDAPPKAQVPKVSWNNELLLLLGSGLAAASGGIGSSPLGFTSLAILAVIPVGAVIIAVAVARSTLLRALRASL